MSADERDATLLVEKVARAICRKITGLGADWREYILAAQIAIFGADNVDVDASNHARGVTQPHRCIAGNEHTREDHDQLRPASRPVVASARVSGLDLAAIEREVELAHGTVSALCEGRERWRMSIPAEPERDSDLVISRALGHADTLVAEVKRLREDNAALVASKSDDWQTGYDTGCAMSHSIVCGAAQDHRDSLLDAVERVRELHQPHKSIWTPRGWRGACGVDGAIYPCPTIRALDGAS